MLRPTLEVLAILAATLLAIGCATTHAPRPPRLVASQAIDLARAEAIRQDVDMHRVMAPRASYDPEHVSWFVFWDQQPDKAGMVYIGGDYGAQVDDVSGHVTLLRGK